MNEPIEFELGVPEKNPNTPKIYVFANGKFGNNISAVGIAEDGTYLAGHICSSEGFIPHDMGQTSEWKHDVYYKHYPKGFEVIFVPQEDIDGHSGLQEAIENNKKKQKASE